MMKSLSFYEQQHLQRLFQQEGQIKYLFDDFVRRVSPLLAKWSNHGGDQVWVRNTRIENAIDKELSGLHASLLNFITDATIQSWNRGNRKVDDLVRSYIEGMPVSEVLRDKMFSRNADALNALLKRKDNNGFTVSERVWKVAGGMKDNLEYYLSSGLSAGRPATLISQDVRQLLNEPGRRFRRVRNEEGKLVMSKPMSDYHPGQGVYRSAYKNALRLTATQTNIGFRQADHDRWQKMDFVLGIEIKRSASNHGPCKICDAMVGKYPKGFVFTGAHPFCICVATPILMDHEEFADFLLDEKIPNEKVITTIPDRSKAYMNNYPVMQQSFIYRENKEYFTEKTEAKYERHEYKSGGVLYVLSPGKQNKQEEQKNTKAYEELAKYYGAKYRLLPVINEPGRKNPDAYNLLENRYSDVKVPVSDNGKNAIQASIKAAAKQGVSEVYIYLEKEYERTSVYAGIKAGLYHGRARSLKSIIIRFSTGEIKRYDVEKVRKALKTSKG